MRYEIVRNEDKMGYGNERRMRDERQDREYERKIIQEVEENKL